jgi:hypothetical protein
MGKIEKAQFRYNGGRGALLCSGCKKIMKTGDEFTEEEIEAIKGYSIIPPVYCLKCQLVNALNAIGKDWAEKTEVRDDIKYKVISFEPPFPQEVMDIVTSKEVKVLGSLSPDGKQGIHVCFPM